MVLNTEKFITIFLCGNSKAVKIHPLPTSREASILRGAGLHDVIAGMFIETSTGELQNRGFPSCVCILECIFWCIHSCI